MWWHIINIALIFVGVLFFIAAIKEGQHSEAYGAFAWLFFAAGCWVVAILSWIIKWVAGGVKWPWA